MNELSLNSLLQTPFYNMSAEAAPMAPPVKKRMMDWDTWQKEGECDDEDYLDQLDGLPNSENVTLPEIEPILTGKGDFEAWSSAITKVLRSNGLMGLISRPRPLFLNEQSREWAHISLEVASWMKNSIEQTLYCKLCDMGESCIYADAIMRNAKLLLQGVSLADAKRMRKLIQLKPTDFDETFKYVMAYADLFESACVKGTNIDPYTALLTVLLNIQYSDSATYYKIHHMLQVDSGGNKDLAEWVTEERFQYYITQVIKLMIDDDQNSRRKVYF